MSDIGPVVPVSLGRNFGDKSVEELEAMLDNLTPEGDIPAEPPAPAPSPEPEPTPPAEEPPAPAEPAPEPPGAPEPEPTPDLSASEREGDRIARERLEAALALQQAHSSRLAGEIGFLKTQLKSLPHATEPYQPETQAEVDRLTALERQFADSEAKRTETAVSQAVEAEIAALDGTWSTDLAKEIAEVAPRYAEHIGAARQSTDPVLARQIIKGVVLMVKAEATHMRWEAKHKAMEEQKAASTAANAKAKKAAAPSASGTVPAPQPKPKAYGDMTAAEADAWLRANVPW